MIQEAIQPLKNSNARLLWSKQHKIANKTKHPETHVTLNIPEVYQWKFDLGGTEGGKTAVSQFITTCLLNVAKQHLGVHIFQFKLPAHTVHVISTLLC